jgi:lipopolysaccharide/colanic/teichoic acid biosynthesis glycosyltransferase
VPDRLQRVIAFLAALLTSPLLLVLAVAIRLAGPGPVLYRSRRIGEGGRPFDCLKLRTMVWQPASPGSGITVAGDRRVTSIGRRLRTWRLDELPQLWQVAAGSMRLVGPRPEDPRFVDLTDPIQREVFTSRPGITGLSQLLHIDEAAQLDESDPDGHYRAVILPRKLVIDAAYLRHRSARLDLWILAATPLAVLGRQPVPPEGLLPAGLIPEPATPDAA